MTEARSNEAATNAPDTTPTHTERKAPNALLDR